MHLASKCHEAAARCADAFRRAEIDARSSTSYIRHRPRPLLRRPAWRFDETRTLRLPFPSRFLKIAQIRQCRPIEHWNVSKHGESQPRAPPPPPSSAAPILVCFIAFWTRCVARCV
ncbi:hypothetical protein EVAR_57365_1 [Eumeta japonica]|uniref:Uncharacterized protein n=1 Tax=Eumeta variegata TaxID=151549 RepID=A0A4C1ZGK5_EUMVA|nr:hypothetical protein EVAR_57365_1 [Eumeta japonica]